MTLVSRITRTIVAASLCALPLGAQTVRHRAVAPPSNITVTITGIISDQNTGQPIAGADVTAEGRKSKTTGADGKYSINITKGLNVAVTAEHYAYNSKTLPVLGQEGATLNFALQPKPHVTVKLTHAQGDPARDTFTLDIDSAQFAYLIPFSGYVRGDVANFCTDAGKSITPDKHDIARVVGPAQSVNFAPCCTIGPIMKANVEMKNGDKFAVYFNDSCFGNEVDFLGRDVTTGLYQYFKFTDIAEVDFP